MSSPSQVGRAPLAALRSLGALDAAHAAALGEETADLFALRAAGVPVADGIVAPLAHDAREAIAREIVRVALARFRLRTVFPTRAAAARFERRLLTPRDVEGADAAIAAFDALEEAAHAPEVKAALGGRAGALAVRVHATDRSVPDDVPSEGRAASADPVAGDPDLVTVWVGTAPPWTVDRRTARVVDEGQGGLDARAASDVADLADRAQLALGRPVEIEWAHQGGRPCVLGVRTLSLVPRFTASPYRIVTLIAQDEGTVAPLAIDALNKALGKGDDPAAEPRVRRIYARPYRRLDERTPLSSATDPVSFARASAQAARVAVDVVAPLRAVGRFDADLAARLGALDRADVAGATDGALALCLRDRERLVIEAFDLLERGKNATLATLLALEGLLGPLPREVVPALAHPKPSRERRRVEEKLARLAARIEKESGEIVDAPALAPATRRRVEELAAELGAVRAIGIDVRPEPLGASAAAMRDALRAARAEPEEAHERARKDAGRRLLATARVRPLGRAREAVCASLLLVLDRVARAKGAAAEGLASAMLRLRAAACEAGRRLAEQGTLDAAEDALYLDLTEIEQALGGEPGAYAARVRLRREDDARWARYDAPRRIVGTRA